MRQTMFQIKGQTMFQTNTHHAINGQTILDNTTNISNTFTNTHAKNPNQYQTNTTKRTQTYSYNYSYSFDFNWLVLDNR